MMTKFQDTIARLVREDRAENSIMQTISIAVSAILIAAGLITAPGLINTARDNNAKTDLANAAYAEEYAIANGGSAILNLSSLTGVKFTASAGTTDSGAVSGQAYVLKSVSASTNVFFRDSSSAAITGGTPTSTYGGSVIATPTFAPLS